MCLPRIMRRLPNFLMQQITVLFCGSNKTVPRACATIRFDAFGCLIWQQRCSSIIQNNHHLRCVSVQPGAELGCTTVIGREQSTEADDSEEVEGHRTVESVLDSLLFEVCACLLRAVSPALSFERPFFTFFPTIFFAFYV